MREREEALISVIVPVYNGQDYLEGCIRSIEEQTYHKTEIIIVNDGSTDNTGKVCETLREAYDNIRVIALDDKGVSAARNIGIQEAKGDYLTFVDADDRLCRETLQILYDCLSDTESDIAGCRFFLWKNETEWEEHSREKVEKKAYLKPRVFTPDTYVKDAILQGNSRCWSKLYRREILRGIRFEEGLTIGEDMLFVVKLLSGAKRIAELEYPGYGYFQNPGGAILRAFTPRYMDQITCWELAREELQRQGRGEDAYRQVTALLMVGIMLTAGKLAELPYSERKKQEKYIQICHKKLKENLSVKGAYGRLSGGYRLKVRFFQMFPKLYLASYHARKRCVNG